MEMTTSDDEQRDENDEDDEVRWNEESSLSGDSELGYMAIEDLKKLEAKVADNAFIHVIPDVAPEHRHISPRAQIETEHSTVS